MTIRTASPPRRLRRLCGTILLLAAGLAGAQEEAPPAPVAPAPPGPPPVDSVLLVSIDSLRADHLALYGYPRETMPRLAAFAREHGALVFDRMTAASPSCHPSHTAMLTGLYPQQVGVPGCGEDLLAGPQDLSTPEGIADLAKVQEDLEKQPPRLARKRVSAVINWLKIPEGTPTLATYFAARGIATGGFVSIWTLQHQFGYDRGFDVYQDDLPEYYGPKSLIWLLRDTFHSQERQLGATTVDDALEYLHEVPANKPFFLFLHLADAHVPYRTVEGYDFRDETPAERARVRKSWRSHYTPETWTQAWEKMTAGRAEPLLESYDRAILYEDAQLARVLDELAASGRLAHTLVIVTADHGDGFGQHRYLSRAQAHRLFFEHTVFVWQETEHVPLVVFDPSLSPGAVTHRGVTASHVDLVPTILARIGLPLGAFATETLPGADLLHLADVQRTVFFLTYGRGRPGIVQGLFLEYPRFIGLRSGDLAFFVDRERFRHPAAGRCFLYDLATDPDEKTNLCAGEEARSERAARLREVLVDWYASSVAPRAVPVAAPPTRPAATTLPPPR